MPLVYLVIDHWSNFEELLYNSGVRRFFCTSPSLLSVANRLKDIDCVFDNGAYKYGRAVVPWTLMFAREGFKYIMPDIIGDPEGTFKLHLKFADMVGERELSNGFVVLQGSNLEENIKWLDIMREHGLVKRYVAFGGSLELRSRRREDEELCCRLYREVRRYGYWFHVLGRARWCCDSFDTASWGYRMLEQRLSGRKYSIEPVLKFISKYESSGLLRWFT